jgi:hypothetical protein
MTDLASSRVPPKPPGTWARKAAPRWAYTTFDAAERLQVSPSRITQLLRAYGIPTGIRYLPVRLADGSLRKRRVRVIPPTSLRHLLLAHAGLSRTGRPNGKAER